ncbi:hypothetical protein FACS1894127_4830 [Clostridia bacterium]|nr:hypothetical protein FACS1894127_4830 [Clostridia bacterium]
MKKKKQEPIESVAKEEPVAQAAKEQEPVAQAAKEQEPVAQAAKKQEPIALITKEQESIAQLAEQLAKEQEAVAQLAAQLVKKQEFVAQVTKEQESVAEAVKVLSKSIINEETSFTTVEEYKMLRTAVSFAVAVSGGKCKVVGVTSPLSSDGKSVTCMNLAVAFAMMKSKVLILDCDLRRPVIAQSFRCPSSPGTSNVLAEACPLDESIRKITHNGVTFDIMPSGDIPPNPSELLGSAAAKALFEKLAKSYDYIFVDLPPVMVVSDALVLSKLLSGVILVVRSGQTKRDDVKRSLDRLRFVEANILGFVLNGMPRRGRRGGKKYHVGDYNYGYGYGKR